MAADGERKGISRRGVLVGGGIGVGLVVAWAVWPREYGVNLRAAEGETVLGAYLKIGRDGRVVVAVPQAEMGQGVWTTLPQVLADELGADWRTVAVEPAPLSPLYANGLIAEETAAAGLPSSFHGIGRWAARESAARGALMLTGGSTSARAFEPRLREAGAAARALLSMAAGERWNVPWEELDTRDGFVWRGEERIPFAELAESAAGRTLPDDLPIRGGGDNRLYGQALPRLDVPAKIDGSALFAADVRLPDMVYAAVRSGPPGSRLARVDRAAADAVPGALTLFEGSDWAGVAGTNWWAANKALDALRAVFEMPAGADARGIEAALDAALDGGEPARLYETGGDAAAPIQGATPLAARYAAGPLASAALETLCATARAASGRLEIWAPVQAPGLARAAAARAVGLAEERVTVHATLAGGGYGRKLETDAIEQAAIMAVKLGRPVQLVWPRIQELQRERMNPPAAALLSAQLGQGGAVLAWSARVASGDAVGPFLDRMGAGSRLVDTRASGAAGAVPPYAIPNVAVDHVAAETGLESGLVRGGAHIATCFFTECFVDELARAAAIEPFSFRMQMLSGNPRLARVLGTATSYGGWDGGPPGSGMGLACLSAFGSHIATLVEIEIAGNRPKVIRAVCAADVGRAINPDVVRQQIEGGLLFGIGAALGESAGHAGGTPAARTFADLRLPRLADSPEVTVELVESDEDPGGVTELAVPTAAPAIANALHSLTGQRLRRLPLQLGRET
jgi:isoquinoline 1-oxidoreductase subunit beta